MTMENNNSYNLMTQITQESKSLWRIQNHYVQEATNLELKAFWEKLAKDKESHITEMKAFLKAEM